jgi:hypothetical protein
MPMQSHYPNLVGLPSSGARRGLFVGAAVLVLLAGVVFALYRVSPFAHPPPGCTVSLVSGPPTDPDAVSDFPLTPEQADNAATIAGVGSKLGMPDHAVTVAIATALQESGLRNLAHGDRDSLGLFQQRPSQGWGTPAQISDPVYAATAFYQRLRQQPNWTNLEVTEAAQLVQRSAAPQAYAQWESTARATAAALTGESGASLSCHNLKLGAPEQSLVTVAKRELGTAALSGPHEPQRTRTLGYWLVAHAVRFGVDRVTMSGLTWTAQSGGWTRTGPDDGVLSLHQVSARPS